MMSEGNALRPSQLGAVASCSLALRTSRAGRGTACAGALLSLRSCRIAQDVEHLQENNECVTGSFTASIHTLQLIGPHGTAASRLLRGQ